MQSYDVAEWGKPLQMQLRETPKPGPDEVLVKLSYCGVCHSDVHIREVTSTWAAATSSALPTAAPSCH